MKIYINLTVARQELGEYVFVNVEKAWTTKEKAEQYAKDKSRVWKESIQGVTCECERGVVEIEVEGGE